MEIVAMHKFMGWDVKGNQITELEVKIYIYLFIIN